jgi:SAM-dependent methyltransferase
VTEGPPPICDYEGSDYQERFWESGERAYEDGAEAVALRRLLPAAGGTLLEVGAGAGRNTPRYAGFQKIVLLDYSRSQLEMAHSRLGESERYLYVAGDVYRLPFAPSVFQAATVIRTLHHMTDPLLALREVRATLAGGSALILEYANKHNLKAIARWLLRRQSWSPFDRRPVEFARLNFDFHPAAVRAWLGEAGFAVRRQLTVSHFRVGLLKRTLPASLLVGMDALIQWTGDWWQLSPSVFVLATAVGESEPAAGGFWRCPACRSLDVSEEDTGVQCQGCKRVWPQRGGIYDFRME